MVYGYHSSQGRSKVLSIARVDVASPCSSQSTGRVCGCRAVHSSCPCCSSTVYPTPAGAAGSLTQPAQSQGISLQGSVRPQPWPTPGSSWLTQHSKGQHTQPLLHKDLHVQPINISLSVHNWPLNNCLQCPATLPAASQEHLSLSPHPCHRGSRVRIPLPISCAAEILTSTRLTIFYFPILLTSVVPYPTACIPPRPGCH